LIGSIFGPRNSLRRKTFGCPVPSRRLEPSVPMTNLITGRGTHYDEDELFAAQAKGEQAEKIYTNWKKLKQTRTLAFCSSIKYADFLASYFREQRERAISLHSQTKEMTRADPPGCLVDLNLRVVDLLKEIARKRQLRKDRLLAAYLDLKREMDRRPTYLELDLQGREDSPQYRREFGSYAGFLHWAGELDGTEQSVYLARRRWHEEAEKTSMVNSYKMVLLLAMPERRQSGWYKPIAAREAAPFFHQYLTEKEYRSASIFRTRKQPGSTGMTNEGWLL